MVAKDRCSNSGGQGQCCPAARPAIGLSPQASTRSVFKARPIRSPDSRPGPRKRARERGPARCLEKGSIWGPPRTALDPGPRHTTPTRLPAPRRIPTFHRLAARQAGRCRPVMRAAGGHKVSRTAQTALRPGCSAEDCVDARWARGRVVGTGLLANASAEIR